MYAQALCYLPEKTYWHLTLQLKVVIIEVSIVHVIRGRANLQCQTLQTGPLVIWQTIFNMKEVIVFVDTVGWEIVAVKNSLNAWLQCINKIICRWISQKWSTAKFFICWWCVLISQNSHVYIAYCVLCLCGCRNIETGEVKCCIQGYYIYHRIWDAYLHCSSG